MLLVVTPHTPAVTKVGRQKLSLLQALDPHQGNLDIAARPPRAATAPPHFLLELRSRLSRITNPAVHCLEPRIGPSYPSTYSPKSGQTRLYRVCGL